MIKVIRVNNTPLIFKDEADLYLTIGKSYLGRYHNSTKSIYIENSDRDGPPFGHRHWDSIIFTPINEIRLSKIDELLK